MFAHLYIEPTIQNGFLVAYSKMGTNPPSIPAAFTGWPSSGIFVSLDASVITAAANVAIPLISLPHDSFSWEIFTGSYGISLGKVSSVSVKSDGTGALVSTDVGFLSYSMTIH
jgi:hypothetical protein